MRSSPHSAWRRVGELFGRGRRDPGGRGRAEGPAARSAAETDRRSVCPPGRAGGLRPDPAFRTDCE